MNSNSNELPVSAGFVEPRRCENLIGCEDQSRPCGWHLFDQVVVLADVSAGAPSCGGEVLRFDGYACRSCGAVQPDGLPEGLFAKL